MVFLTRIILHLFSHHEKKNTKVNHCMKISGIIKWMYRNNDLKKDVLDNMNIQIINSINYIDPNKIINNLIINKNKEINMEKKKKNYFLKSLKKKIIFNSLLLKTIYCKKNFFFQLYEYNNGKKCIYDNNNINMVKNNNTKEYFDITKTIINNNTTDKSDSNLFNKDNNNFPLINYNMLGRNLKRKKKNLFLNNENVIFKKKNKQVFNEKIINTISFDKKDDLKKSRFNLDTFLYDNNNNNNIRNYKYDHIYDNFKLFDLSYNYNSFLLNNILKNICTYIYHFKLLNKINNELNNGYEYISLILISKIFHYFYEINYGYKYMIHFLNGLTVYKIKKEIDIENLSYEYIKSHINNQDHYNHCHDHLFEKELCISSIINYLCEYDTGTQKGRNNINDRNELIEKKKKKNSIIDHVNNISSYNSINYNDKNSFVHTYTFVSHDKKKTYIINMKEKLLLHYNIDESFLNYFLNILGEKYNIEKLPFISYSFLMHMYSMSNHFIVHFFSLCPLLFVKNKIHADISIYIILLNSCVFFLCSKSYMTSFSSFIINTKNEDEKHLVYNQNKLIEDENVSTERKNETFDEYRKTFQDTDNVNMVKEKIYCFIEQIINYLYINKDILNNNQLLHILEIFSFIKYNKEMFTYIINTLINNLSILDKYETIYLLHSLSNYYLIYNDIKNNIYKEALKKVEEYTPQELKQLECYIQVK
ncbi:conserved Plasmodium protein, unknown function [Plasmodium sp. gorilla clade G3]|nr:conserved Plasmodium protein, unknown function [Plasmodium sp. gorilla clade G3]